MDCRDIRMTPIGFLRVLVLFLPVTITVSSCYLTISPYDAPAEDAGIDEMTTRGDASAVTDSGSDPTTHSEDSTVAPSPLDSSTDNPPPNEATPDATTGEEQPGDAESDFEWEPIAPEQGIETDGEVEPPLGLWVGQTRETIDCLMSNRVIMQIASGEGTGTAFGFVVFGDAPPPPPAKDPDVGYPLGDDDREMFCHQQKPTEGFEYKILDGRISDDGRFRFRIAVVELFEPWCALQMSYKWDRWTDTRYDCLPELEDEVWNACNDESPDCPYDYLKFRLCDEFGPCICTARGCAANMNRTLRFDLLVSDGTMEGLLTNLSLGEAPPQEIRFQRAR